MPTLSATAHSLLSPALLLLFACAFGFASISHAADDKRTLVCFGDSLTAGYGLDNPAVESYPGILQKKIDAAGLDWRVVNAGLSGETSAGGLRRVDWMLRQRVDVFLLALGANDGLRGIDPAVTQRNLEDIIGRVRAKHPKAKIVVAGMQMPAFMGEDFTRRYNAMFAEVAKKQDTGLIPFLLEGVAADSDLNQPDGIHPTAAGHKRLAQNVWNVLRPLL